MTEDQICTVKFHAGNAAQNAAAAYWAKSSREFLVGMLLDDLRGAAKAAGYTLSPIVAEPVEVAE